MDIAIVVFKNTLKSACFAIEELFQVNNLYTKQKDEVEINIHFVSTGKIDFLEAKPLSKYDTYDVILIPPIMSQNDFNWIDEKLNSWLIAMYHKSSLLTSACVGSFYLAQTKLLDNKKATTHWAYSDLFKKSFPKVDLDTDKILIDEGSIITAGGVTAYTDLCLYLIEKFHSNKTATNIANLFVVDKSRDSQKGYKSFSTIFLIDDEDIKKSINWMKENLKEQISNHILAKRLNLSERTFTRRFKKALNTTPNSYMQKLRIEKAKELLITTNKSFDDITFEVGFFNESSFRKLFKRETSLNPKDYKKRFQQHF